MVDDEDTKRKELCDAEAENEDQRAAEGVRVLEEEMVMRAQVHNTSENDGCSAIQDTHCRLATWKYQPLPSSCAPVGSLRWSLNSIGSL